MSELRAAGRGRGWRLTLWSWSSLLMCWAMKLTPSSASCTSCWNLPEDLSRKSLAVPAASEPEPEPAGDLGVADAGFTKYMELP